MTTIVIEHLVTYVIHLVKYMITLLKLYATWIRLVTPENVYNSYFY